MTPPQEPLHELLDRLEKLESDATPAPWVTAPIFKSQWPERRNDVADVRGILIHGPYEAVSCGAERDLIVESRNALPRLIRELRERMGK